MLLLSFILVNFAGATILYLYCKLTCGICKCSKHLNGKVVIVTGGNAGIGYESAKDLADRGARVIIGCRSEARGTAARDKIIAETGNKDVHYQPLDLASLSSVRAFAKNILETEKKLDILMNNAGIFESKNGKTEDGLLIGMQTNHFGPFLLTVLLLPLLKSSAPSRIINVSSLLYMRGEIDFENLNMEKNNTFSINKVYSNSKLCNILMTVELARQLKGTGVTANCLHPGAVKTEIKSPYKRITDVLSAPFTKDAWEGAQTQIYLAVSPDVKDVSGEYFSDCELRKTNQAAQNTKTARQLWEISEKLVKLK